MFFGPVPASDAEGGILGHSLAAGSERFRKGRILSHADCAALRAAGHEKIYIARLGPDDVPEDEAARRIAQAAAGPGARVAAAFTGRANLYAESAGLVVLDADGIERLNAIDEAATIATLAPFDTVEPSQMLATIKIIPFAAPRMAVEQAENMARARAPLVRVAPFTPHQAGLVMSRVADTKDSVLDKTEAALRLRLEKLGSSLKSVRRVAHDEQEIAAAIRELEAAGCAPILVFGGSAIVDRHDVVPAGLVAAGGDIEHFGMPVDPGNLLLAGRLNDVPVIGVPGCARSPKLNGFDWVLQRLCAGLPVRRRELAGMGLGGLLKEIPTRPMPRAQTEKPAAMTAQRRPRIAAIILAAGLSSRMQGENKLLAELNGKPLVGHVAAHLAQTTARPLLLVTGHRAEEVESAARAGLRGTVPVSSGAPELTVVRNNEYVTGLASSLKAGIAALPGDCDGVLICLGDMPDIPPAVIEKLIAAFNPVEGRAICVPCIGPKRGNPVLWGADFFPELMRLGGDSGARRLLGDYPEAVCDVAVEDAGILRDIDTLEALAARRQGGNFAETD